MKIIAVIAAAVLSGLAWASLDSQINERGLFKFRVELTDILGNKSGTFEIPNDHHKSMIRSDIYATQLYMNFEGFANPKDPGLRGMCSFFNRRNELLGWNVFDEATTKAIDTLNAGPEPTRPRQIYSKVGWVQCHTFRVRGT